MISLFLEAVNFWIIGYPAALHPLSRVGQIPAVALQWYLAHLPGIYIGDHSVYIRQHPHLQSLVLFLSGFLDTALLLLLAFWLAALARLTLRKLSSPMKQLA